MATAKANKAQKRAGGGAKKPPAKPPAAHADGRLPKNKIRIRMYRIGFGDCFLVSLPNLRENAKTSHRHILVDCGVHGKGDIRTMERALDNVAEVTGKRLAVVIATHAHQDHISGFGKFAEKFSQFDIDEVWMPWAMDKQHPQASRFIKKQNALVEQLEHHFEALAAQGTQVKSGVLEAIENLRGNARALEMLRNGFGVNAQVRYLTAGDKLKTPAQIEGLSVKVLGPPLSEEFLAQMDPPTGHHYLKVVNGAVVSGQARSIFPSRWVIKQPGAGVPRLTDEERQELQTAAALPLDELAFSLNKVMNNTSLATLLVFRGQYLLFPGDAEYGNWRWWLEKDDADDILSRVNFYKVAHHGSFNATPKDAVEKMNQGSFGAMVSTQSKPWDSIPQPALMDALSDRTRKRIVRSDWLQVDGAPGPLPGGRPLKPSHLPSGFREGPIWYDYFVSL